MVQIANRIVTVDRSSNANGMDVSLVDRIMRVDTSTIVTATIIGKAAPGTAVNVACWKIYKFDSSGNKLYRYGSSAYDQVWSSVADDGNWS
jgi:ribosomal protein L18E